MENNESNQHEPNSEHESDEHLPAHNILREGGEPRQDRGREENHGGNKNQPPVEPWFWTHPFWTDGKRVALSLIFDFLLLVATGTYTYFASRQWKAMNGQLGQMQAAGAQTDQLICLYQKQVVKLGEQVSKTDDLANRTKDLADNALKQAVATKNLATTAQEAINIQNRPWTGISDVTIDVEPDRGGFVVTAEHAILRNYGASPAINVFYDFFDDSMFPTPMDWSNCEKLKPREEGISKALGYDPASAAFPDKIGTPISILKQITVASNVVAIVACVSYQTTFNKEWHHTRTFYIGNPPTDKTSNFAMSPKYTSAD